jgi:hypothetical protein
MKAVLKACFIFALASTCLIGFGTVTAEKVEAKFPPTGTCPSLSGHPDSSDSYLGECDHPCGGTCDRWRDSDTGQEFYDVTCPLS